MRGIGLGSRGRRGFADEDLRVGKGSGIRPGMLQPLAFGGEADSASADTRVARKPGTRPRMLDMLFSGGTAEPAEADARVGKEPKLKPGMLDMLAEGGDVLETDDSDALLGHELLAVMDGGMSSDRGERAKKVMRILKAAFMKWDAEPHEEGEHETWEGGEEKE